MLGEPRTTAFFFDVASASATAASSSQFTAAYSLLRPTPSAASTALPLLVFSHPFNNARDYWRPQVDDPTLASYTKVVLDAIGFGLSSTHGAPWSFDLAAHSILVIVDELEQEGVIGKAGAVVVGDSMGGGPTGLRVALQDAERVRETGGEPRIRGVVACGTAAEEESTDFVEEYTEAAHDFARECLDPAIGVERAIEALAYNMCQAGYTASLDEPFAAARKHGQSVIEGSLRLALTDEQGELVPTTAGEIMVRNYATLDDRRSLIPHLASRPSRLGTAQVLVVHGTEDAAYPFDRDYHTRTVSAIGTANAELYVVKGGPHFVTATHFDEVDKVIDEWIRRKCLKE